MPISVAMAMAMSILSILGLAEPVFFTLLWSASPAAAIPGVHQQLVAGGAGEEAAHRLGGARPLQAVKSLQF